MVFTSGFTRLIQSLKKFFSIDRTRSLQYGPVSRTWKNAIFLANIQMVNCASLRGPTLKWRWATSSNQSYLNNSTFWLTQWTRLTQKRIIFFDTSLELQLQASKWWTLLQSGTGLSFQDWVTLLVISWICRSTGAYLIFIYLWKLITWKE